jgi:protein O-mannosyl-transferase
MKSALVIGLLIGANLLVYHNTFRGDFIYDDQPLILGNPVVREPTSLRQFFLTPYWGNQPIQENAPPQGGLYRPLAILSFALNFRMGGEHPLTYHLFNIALHIGVCILLFFLCLRLGFTSGVSAFAAIIFALLPVHTEAVSNIAGRAELLSAFFVLAAWLLLAQTETWGRIGVGSCLFVLALLSKENSVAFLPALVLSDWFTERGSWKSLVSRRGRVWAALGGCFHIYLGFRIWLLGSLTDPGGLTYFEGKNRLVSLLTLSLFFWSHYARALALGTPLCADFTRPQITDASMVGLAGWLALLALLALIVGSGILLWRKRDRTSYGIILFFVLLFPVSNVLFQLEVIGAERFLYLPSIGFAMALGVLFEALLRTRRELGGFFIVSLLACYGLLTYTRNSIWKSAESFWSATLSDAPRSPRALNGMGSVLVQRGQVQEAMVMIEQAMILNPLLLDAHENLATCFYLQGDYRRAKAGFEYVLKRKPYYSAALYKLAQIAEKEKQFQSARQFYQQILELHPNDGFILKRLERLPGVRR